MKGTCVLFLFYCLFHYSDAWLTWSKSYILKAVLTVPAANLSEPYQVWVNGDTKMSRVDFYNGMDKMYRQWNELSNEYEYYKIHPETTKQYTIIDVCNSESGMAADTQTYAQNTYLPAKNFKFKINDKLNDIEAQKWEVAYTLDHSLNTSVTYTIWVTFRKESENTPIPLRYVYEMKVGNNLLDYFRHDYSLYEDVKPEDATVTKPLGLECKDIAEQFDEEAVDPLLEYVDPQLEHLRVNKVFDSFKEKHNKIYRNKMEYLRRLNIFKNNLRYINSMNRQHRSFSLGVNHFADLTEKEMLVFMGTMHSYRDVDQVKRDDSDLDNDDDIAGDNVNSSFDWREFGALTAVIDQTALCGSCYAFSTASAVESAAYIARGCKRLKELSEQAILDCSWGDGTETETGGNFGCSGGTHEYTLKWLKVNGLPTREEYGSYLALEGRCHISNMTKLATIKSYEALPRKKQVIKDTLRKAGPLLTSINTSPRSFMLYTSGVYDDAECHKEPDKRTHGVTLVGYGRQSEQEYWIIKNSFGAGWGEDGYMRLASKANVCGLKNFAYSLGFRKSRAENCHKK